MKLLQTYSIGFAKAGDTPKPAEAGHVLSSNDQPDAQNFLIQSEKDLELTVQKNYHQTTLGDHLDIAHGEQFWKEFSI